MPSSPVASAVDFGKENSSARSSTTSKVAPSLPSSSPPGVRSPFLDLAAPTANGDSSASSSGAIATQMVRPATVAVVCKRNSGIEDFRQAPTSTITDGTGNDLPESTPNSSAVRLPATGVGEGMETMDPEAGEESGIARCSSNSRTQGVVDGDHVGQEQKVGWGGEEEGPIGSGGGSQVGNADVKGVRKSVVKIEEEQFFECSMELAEKTYARSESAAGAGSIGGVLARELE
ncbi:unnamed protein product, partial [Discosporangium mesarthrocarpum]